MVEPTLTVPSIRLFLPIFLLFAVDTLYQAHTCHTGEHFELDLGRRCFFLLYYVFHARIHKEFIHMEFRRTAKSRFPSEKTLTHALTPREDRRVAVGLL